MIKGVPLYLIEQRRSSVTSFVALLVTNPDWSTQPPYALTGTSHKLAGGNEKISLKINFSLRFCSCLQDI